MKKLLDLLLIVAILIVPMAIALTEETTVLDLSAYSDSELLTLLFQVQSEVASRKIEKAAQSTVGTYIGGRDIQVGSYILAAAGNENEHGIISLRSFNDPEDNYPSKPYAHKRGEETYSVFIAIEEGNILILPFSYTLTISGG